MTPSERAGVHQAAIESALTGLNVSIPAVVLSVQDSTVTVRPSIAKPHMKPNGTRTYQQTTEIESVPIVGISGGGFSINLPLKEGDKGLLIFCDYDIDAWLNNELEPYTARTHDQNDCFFIPAFNGAISSGTNLEIKSATTKLILGNGFDVVHNGQSLISTLNGCCEGSFNGWNP